MHNFDTLIQLLAVINFGYIISDYFIEYLIRIVTNNFNDLNNKIDGLSKQHSENTSVLLSLDSYQNLSIEISSTTQELLRLIKESKSLKIELEDFKKNINDFSSTKANFKILGRHCALAGFFLISVLIINGSHYYNSWYLLVFSSIPFMVHLYLYVTKQNFTNSNENSDEDDIKKAFQKFNLWILYFILPFILLIFYFILYIIRTNDFTIIDGNTFYKISNSILYWIILSLIILNSTLHLVVYYFKIVYYCRNKNSNGFVKCRSFEQELKSISASLKTFINLQKPVLEDISKHNKNKHNEKITIAHKR